MDLGLSGKLVVVTGAARGIGEAIAASFVGEGSRVLLADRDEAVTAVADKLKGSALVLDLCSATAAKEIADAARGEGGAAVLVNNAGISQPASLPEISDWDTVMDVNVGVAFRLTQALWQQLSGNDGAVVNLASFAAKRSTLFGGNASYVASKHAVAGLTRAAAFEGATQGVRVNAVAPGVVETEMIKAVHDDQARARIKSFIPQGRFATPNEIADVILFLASARSAHICGEIVNVNGGMCMD